jgi:predicted RNA polymerase sigma factor
MFACAHPAIEPGIRAPLILQTILGFDAATIASAFLVAPATMGQRLHKSQHRALSARGGGTVGARFASAHRAADWAAIVQLYDALFAMTGSPVVAINRAVALAETQGPAAGLAALDALANDARLADYQPYLGGACQALGTDRRLRRCRERLRTRDRPRKRSRRPSFPAAAPIRASELDHDPDDELMHFRA